MSYLGVDVETNSISWELVNQVKESSIYLVFPIGIISLGNQVINQGISLLKRLNSK